MLHSHAKDAAPERHGHFQERNFQSGVKKNDVRAIGPHRAVLYHAFTMSLVLVLLVLFANVVEEKALGTIKADILIAQMEDENAAELSLGKKIANKRFKVANSSLMIERYLSTEGPVKGFGRLSHGPVTFMRLLIADYTDAHFKIIGYPMNPNNTWSDEEFQQFFIDKIALWSNETHHVLPNGDKSVERINMKRKRNSFRNCRDVRTRAFKQKVNQEVELKSSTNEHKFLAVICWKGSGNGAGIQLSNSSLPSYFHEYGHKLRWGHSGSFMKTKSGHWSHWAEYGDLLSSSGGMFIPRGIDHFGPEGFLPMQKHGFGWLNSDSYLNLVVPNTYRLRTIREGTIRTSQLPSALVWRDLVYDTDIWYSFYQEPLVFGREYEKQERTNKHGRNLGFAAHIPYGPNRKGSLRIESFGKRHVTANGLVFETLSYDEDYVEVRVTFDKEKQTTWIPTFNVQSRAVNPGSKTRVAQTMITVIMTRKFDQKKTLPFAISKNVTLQCEWGTFTNSYGNNEIVTIAPKRLFAGSVSKEKDHARKGHLEQYSNNVIVQFKEMRQLKRQEKKNGFPCTLFIGRFLSTNVNVYFR